MVTNDPIDALQQQWQAELPDLDTTAMATVARLNRARALAMQQINDSLEAADSSIADFDVLATLRRQGPPYRMKPSSIAKAVMLSASGMTNRIDQLERAGLVERVTDPTNRRVMPVALTPLGIATAERLVREIVATEQRVLSGLSPKEQATLSRLLAKVCTAAE